jgi:hypothetical protein
LKADFGAENCGRNGASAFNGGLKCGARCIGQRLDGTDMQPRVGRSNSCARPDREGNRSVKMPELLASRYWRVSSVLTTYGHHTLPKCRIDDA